MLKYRVLQGTLSLGPSGSSLGAPSGPSERSPKIEIFRNRFKKLLGGKPPPLFGTNSKTDILWAFLGTPSLGPLRVDSSPRDGPEKGLLKTIVFKIVSKSGWGRRHSNFLERIRKLMIFGSSRRAPLSQYVAAINPNMWRCWGPKAQGSNSKSDIQGHHSCGRDQPNYVAPENSKFWPSGLNFH